MSAKGGASPEKMVRPLMELASLVDLEDVRLRRCRAEMHSEPEGSLLYSISHATHWSLNKERDQLTVEICYSLHSHEESETDHELVSVEVTFALAYRLKSPFLDDECSLFARINAVHNSWPYLREFLQSMTARMSVPVLTIGSFSVASVLARDAPPTPKVEATRPPAKRATSTKRKTAARKIT